MNEHTIGGEVTMDGSGSTLLAERYRVIRQLGQGGMGSVWLAEDIVLDNRKVAVKMLPPVLFANRLARQQLKDEAKVAMRLSHPNIASMRSFEENGSNPFLVEDYIEGQTLDELLAEHGGCLSEEKTVRLLTDVASAIDYAHRQGVVHRDLKPSNVIVRSDGTPFVLDFGIAREIQETMTRMTGRMSSGTLMYMSPEQLKGAVPKPSHDVYAFAAMAYECLAGHPPFCRGQIEYQIVNEPPPPLDPNIAICGSVMAALAKTPDGRPDTCQAVLLAADNAAKPPPKPAPAPRAAAPNPPPAESPSAADTPNPPPRGFWAWLKLVVSRLFIIVHFTVLPALALFLPLICFQGHTDFPVYYYDEFLIAFPLVVSLLATIVLLSGNQRLRFLGLPAAVLCARRWLVLYYVALWTIFLVVVPQLLTTGSYYCYMAEDLVSPGCRLLWIVGMSLVGVVAPILMGLLSTLFVWVIGRRSVWWQIGRDLRCFLVGKWYAAVFVACLMTVFVSVLVNQDAFCRLYCQSFTVEHYRDLAGKSADRDSAPRTWSTWCIQSQDMRNKVGRLLKSDHCDAAGRTLDYLIREGKVTDL